MKMPYRSIPSCLPLFSLASPTSLVCPKFQSRFWRLDRATDYGALNGLASHRLNSKLIAQNGDDFLRVAGSIKMGKVSASELIRTLQWGSKPSLLARALGELGRIPKTLHLLTFIDDPCYRRDILTQLNRGEGLIGSLASAFMASVENSGSGIARGKKINSAPWV
jgi:hypothetical protein